MKSNRISLVCVLGAALLGPIFAKPCPAGTFVRLDFNLGLITPDGFRTSLLIETFDEDRPLTTQNFLQYVNAGLYDEVLMHRLAKDFVLQGGGFYIRPDLQSAQTGVGPILDQDPVDLDGDPNTPNPTVQNEFDNLPFRSNVRGTLAMAKRGGDPNSADTQFFFNTKDNGTTAPAFLDTQNGGFAVFAEVKGEGMLLIDGFNDLETASANPDIGTFDNNGVLVSTDLDGIRDAGPFGDLPFAGNTILQIKTAEVVSSIAATDFNLDGQQDAHDLRDLFEQGSLVDGVPVDSGGSTPPGDPKFDLNADDTIDSADLEKWLTDAASFQGFASPFRAGDTNLDQTINGDDRDNILEGFGAGEFFAEDGTNPGWFGGDIDGDGNLDIFDILEVNRAITSIGGLGNSYAVLNQSATAVPEPSTYALVLACLLGLLFVRRGNRNG